jgi:phospholipase/carboxylesterase
MIVTSHSHLFIPATDPITPPLVLLHGSGGDEHELVPLAADVGPGSPTLGIRGTVPIDGGFAFFHRFEDRTIDEADITARVSLLTDFIEAASARYSFARVPIAIGFSNGAIMAAALLLTRPGLNHDRLPGMWGSLRDDLPVMATSLAGGARLRSDRTPTALTQT